MKKMQRPLFIVISAPSGAGKSTLCDRLLEDFPDMTYSVSCTTREPRGQEVDGVDYHFVSRDGFEERFKAGLFLEAATVHGERYGTLISTVEESLQEGQSVLLDIDVEGVRQIRRYASQAGPSDSIRKGLIDIFIEPPSIEALRERLINRAEDSSMAIARRLQHAREEIKAAGEYRYRIVNEELAVAYRELCELLIAEAGSRPDRQNRS